MLVEEMWKASATEWRKSQRRWRRQWCGAERFVRRGDPRYHLNGSPSAPIARLTARSIPFIFATGYGPAGAR
jgi:hypothetical protein